MRFLRLFLPVPVRGDSKTPKESPKSVEVGHPCLETYDEPPLKSSSKDASFCLSALATCEVDQTGTVLLDACSTSTRTRLHRSPPGPL